MCRKSILRHIRCCHDAICIRIHCKADLASFDDEAIFAARLTDQNCRKAISRPEALNQSTNTDLAPDTNGATELVKGKTLRFCFDKVVDWGEGHGPTGLGFVLSPRLPRIWRGCTGENLEVLCVKSVPTVVAYKAY